MDAWGSRDMPVDGQIPAGSFRGTGSKRVGATNFPTVSRARRARRRLAGADLQDADRPQGDVAFALAGRRCRACSNVLCTQFGSSAFAPPAHGGLPAV
jgi:hypothetical protein